MEHEGRERARLARPSQPKLGRETRDKVVRLAVLQAIWTAEEIRQFIETSSDVPDENRPTLLRLLDFALAHSHAGQITNQKTVHPTFCFKVKGASSKDGKSIIRVLWSAPPTDKYAYVLLGGLKALLPPPRAAEVQNRVAGAGSTRPPSGHRTVA